MERTHIFLLLLIQIIVTFADIDVDNYQNIVEHNDKSAELKFVEDPQQEINDWEDPFADLKTNLFPSPSTTLMAKATQSNKSPEEQLEEIKAMADHLTMLVQNEVGKLIKFAMGCSKTEDESLREKRSIETPMDSTKLIMRLLQHIKSNNEYQNIAIEKMMSAQEIAEKYGIAFDPDTEALTDLAKTANEQALEMTSILKDACDLKNVSQCNSNVNTTIKYEDNKFSNISQYPNNNDYDSKEFDFVPLNYDSPIANDYDHNPSRYNYYDIHRQESQIPQPPLQNHYTSTTPRPNFYDTVLYSAPEYFYCSIEPLAFDEYVPMDLIPEPIVVGEEYEESISSKLLIEPDQEPGSGTVSHITTYTLSEKTHFKNPELENLPEQMQYYFFLV